MKELTEREAFNKAAVYCSRSEHCVSEVCEKLRQWGVSDVDMQQSIVHQLKEELYIDERRFCHAFVHDKFHFNHWGRQKIAMYLCQKRLPSAFIEEALQEIADDESLQAAIIIAPSPKAERLPFKTKFLPNAPALQQSRIIILYLQLALFTIDNKLFKEIPGLRLSPSIVIK
jgi:regulatory protein